MFRLFRCHLCDVWFLFFSTIYFFFLLKQYKYEAILAVWCISIIYIFYDMVHVTYIYEPDMKSPPYEFGSYLNVGFTKRWAFFFFFCSRWYARVLDLSGFAICSLELQYLYQQDLVRSSCASSHVTVSIQHARTFSYRIRFPCRLHPSIIHVSVSSYVFRNANSEDIHQRSH